ncbi:hypothetical protein PC116_g13705 [Phytophthora cactorum]|nr:hypothetical protein PC116_g13705 [Phytophthora cactorum]
MRMLRSQPILIRKMQRRKSASVGHQHMLDSTEATGPAKEGRRESPFLPTITPTVGPQHRGARRTTGWPQRTDEAQDIAMDAPVFPATWSNERGCAYEMDGASRSTTPVRLNDAHSPLNLLKNPTGILHRRRAPPRWLWMNRWREQCLGAVVLV